MNKALFAVLLILILVSLTSLVYLEFFTHYAQEEGLSMSPTFDSQGEAVFYSRTLDANLTGRIILFRLNSTYDVGHRVISDNGTVIRTQGDNPKTNPSPDPWTVTRDQIMGEVYAYCPFWEFFLAIILLIVVFVSSILVLVSIAIKAG